MSIDLQCFALSNSAAIAVKVRYSRLQYVIIRYNTSQVGNRHGRPSIILKKAWREAKCRSEVAKCEHG